MPMSIWHSMPAIRSFVDSVSNLIMPFLYSMGLSSASTTGMGLFLTLYGIPCFSTTRGEIIVCAAPLSTSALIS
ncbi:hypothetical protein IG631_22406 [Alternaria alternata]|nr:hypothetical protein IG631_22406 [Alternaria alternata]